jgi:hypothetical protein
MIRTKCNQESLCRSAIRCSNCILKDIERSPNDAFFELNLRISRSFQEGEGGGGGGAVAAAAGCFK